MIIVLLGQHSDEQIVIGKKIGFRRVQLIVTFFSRVEKESIVAEKKNSNNDDEYESEEDTNLKTPGFSSSVR
jgi:hypothetical protein